MSGQNMISLVLSGGPQQDSNLRTRLRRRLEVSLVSCPDAYPISRVDHVWTAKPRFGATGYHLIRRDLQAYPLPAYTVVDLVECCSRMRTRRQR
jgi:hypothetical protein